MYDKGQGQMNIVNGEDKCSKHQFRNCNKAEYHGSACCDLQGEEKQKRQRVLKIRNFKTLSEIEERHHLNFHFYK